jgi:hypothetical protein
MGCSFCSEVVRDSLCHLGEQVAALFDFRTEKMPCLVSSCRITLSMERGDRRYDCGEAKLTRTPTEPALNRDAFSHVTYD